MEPVQIILNPNAAGGRGGRMLPELERRLRQEEIPFLLHVTRAPGHARELAALVRGRGASRLLVVGGDGTVHEVVAGLLEGGEGSSELPAIAVLPMGTGNDFHRMLRARRGLDAVIRVLRAGVPRAFEVGIVRWDEGTDYFVNLVGVGIDVEVLRRRVAFARLPGLLQYLGAFVLALVRYRPIPLRVTFIGPDGPIPDVEGPILLSAVTVGPSIGGGFLLSPDARPDDGLLDFFVVEKVGPLKVARYLPGILRGAGGNEPEIHRGKATEIHIRPLGKRRLSFEMDGELMPREASFLDIRVRPDGVRFLELPEEEG